MSKAVYVGVDGKARRVKKGDIGVNGVARLFYAPVDRPPRLPSGYDELEYIYSSNGATISTKVLAMVETKIVAKLQILGSFENNISDQIYIIRALGEGSSSSGRGVNSLSLYINRSSSLFCRIGNAATSFTISIPEVQVAKNLTTPFEVIMQGDGHCSLNGLVLCKD